MARRVVVCGFAGSGTLLDPFIPDVDASSADGCSIIDLSADPTVPNVCLAVLDYGDRSAPAASNLAGSTSGIEDLGTDALSPLPTPRRNRLASRLGVTLQSGDSIVAAVLSRIGAKLRPERDGMLRLRAGGLLLHEQAAVSGGATDSFTYSNGNLDTVSSSVWDNPFDSIPIVSSNLVTISTGSVEHNAIYQTATGSDDNYSQVVADLGASSYNEVSVICRNDNSTKTFYRANWNTNGAGRIQLHRCSAGSYTQIASEDSKGTSGTKTIRVEAEGSTIRMLIDAVEDLSVTDATISTGQYVGIGFFYTGTPGTADDWEGGAIGGGTAHSETPVDDLGLTDTVTAAKAASATDTDNLGLTDVVAAVKAVDADIIDDLGLIDTITAVKAITVEIIDDLGLTDEIEASKTVDVVIADDLGMTDSVSYTGDVTIEIIDVLGITDAGSAIDRTVSVEDDLGLSDSVDETDVGFIVRTITDALGLSDSVGIAKYITVTITDSLGMTDSLDVDAPGTLDRTAVDVLGLSDSVEYSIDRVITIVDDLSITDLVTTITAGGGPVIIGPLTVWTSQSGRYVYEL